RVDEQATVVPIVRHGKIVRRFYLVRCYGYLGLKQAAIESERILSLAAATGCVIFRLDCRPLILYDLPLGRPFSTNEAIFTLSSTNRIRITEPHNSPIWGSALEFRIST